MPAHTTMNIFYLDSDPHVCASLYGDIHVNKMLIETAQLLSTAHRVCGSEIEGIYKSTHENHPCSRWVRECDKNYDWAWHLLKALCQEFRLRRGKRHATERLIPLLEACPDLPYAPEHTLPALAMPDEFKCDDPVVSYRRYYCQKFREGIVTYRWSEERQAPEWLEQ